MKRSRILWLAIAFVVVLATLVLKELYPSAREFNLVVENTSGQEVDQLRLFGEAMEHEVVLVKLPPGQQQRIVAIIRPSGNLRFEVSQGMNRIDHFIVEDTRVLDDLEQRLTIQPGNRIILSRD